MKRLVVVALAMLVASGRVAHADDEGAASYRAIIDRVELERTPVTGQRLTVFLSATTLSGQRLDLTEPRAIKAFAGSTEIKAPYILGAYAGTDADTAIVLVIQAQIDYRDVLPAIVDALEQTLLANLPEHTQVAVLWYGASTSGDKLVSKKAALAKLREVAPDESTEVALLDSIERALPMLKKAKTTPPGRPLRKMILVMSDGRDVSEDRDRVTRLGQRADKEGVRIHSFAFTPKDVRRPLLNLGELSRRSHGTFRWLRRADSWTNNFQQLVDEINKQYVVSYFLGSDESVAGKKLSIKTTGRVEVTSANEVKIPMPSCQGTPCETGYCAGARCVQPRTGGGGGILGWILKIVGGALGVVVLLGFIGFLLQRRQQRAAMPRPMPMPMAMPPGAQLPATAPAPAPVAAPATGPRLYIMSGPRTGHTLPLRHGFMIGKAPTCDLVIDDGYASTNHAQIAMDHFNNCRVYDNNSTNGTFVNGVRVQEYVLQHGMTLRIGSTELRFLAE